MSVHNKGRKHVGEQEYKGIKALLDAKVKVSVIADAVGRSQNTIRWVEDYPTYQEYKDRNKKKQWTETISLAGEPMMQIDPSALLLDKMETIETLLNTLVSVIQDKEAAANVRFWKR